MDSGAECSCISERFYRKLGSPLLSPHPQVKLAAADGKDLGCLGTCELDLCIDEATTKHEFYVCKRLKRECLCGHDFLVENNVQLSGNKDKQHLTLQVEEVKVSSSPIADLVKVKLHTSVVVPPRQVVTVFGKVPYDKFRGTKYWEVTLADLPAALSELSVIKLIFEVPTENNEKMLYIPLMCVNHEHEAMQLRKNLHIADAQPLPKDVQIRPEQGFPETEVNSVDVGNIAPEDVEPLEPGEKLFLTSPADVETHPKVVTPSLTTDPATNAKFEALCKEFEDVFSKSSADIGQTELIQMYIDTGDSPPIAQRPYSLALKHTDWVKKELLTLEEAGVIVKSISPWASPIVIVPKKSAPDEPPRRRMCVDYRALNALLPEVRKVGSSAKGILTQFPLPKIDEMYGDLCGTNVFSNLDVRSGYYHIGLTPDSQPKTAFVVQNGKWEFTRVPFGLSQAPAYFQAMINQMLEGLSFAKGYLDDILIFSKDVNEHLIHLREVFSRLRVARLKLKREKCDFSSPRCSIWATC